MLDELRRRYALLGVEPGVSRRDLAKRYKALVRRWHPDRFAGDPVNQAEASARMRDINQAYRTLLRAASPAARAVESRTDARPAQPGQRLSREEIERMVAAIGTENPIENFFDGMQALFDRFRVAFVVLVVFAAGVSLLAEGRRALAGPRAFFVVYLLVVLCLMLGLHFAKRRESGR
jgi:curved DNA-binding protein CbpA